MQLVTHTCMYTYALADPRGHTYAPRDPNIRASLGTNTCILRALTHECTHDQKERRSPITVTYGQKGMRHTQVGQISETVLEVKGRAGTAGAEDQGLLFSSTSRFHARVSGAPRGCGPIQTRVRFCINEPGNHIPTRAPLDAETWSGWSPTTPVLAAPALKPG